MRHAVFLLVVVSACRLRFDPNDFDPCDEANRSATATHRWNDQCFSVHDVPDTQPNASATCAAIGAHLVTYTTADESDASLGLDLSVNAWLGMEMTLFDGWNWVTGEPTPYARWAPGEPSQMTVGTGVAQQPDGSWIALDRGTLVPLTLCESKLAITSDRVYLARFDVASWDVAREACEQRGGHLATITSAEEQLLVDRISSGRSMWIGATDLGSEGTFTWVTDEPYKFENWAGFEPDLVAGEDCIYTGPNGWADVPCGEMRGSLCELE